MKLTITKAQRNIAARGLNDLVRATLVEERRLIRQGEPENAKAAREHIVAYRLASQFLRRAVLALPVEEGKKR